MKIIKLILIGILIPMTYAYGNPTEQVNKQAPKVKRVIIAVNTPQGVGYFVDSNGTFLFKKQFEVVGAFSEGLARVKQNGQWGFINTKGDMVIPCIYDYAGDFSEGLAPVWLNGKCSYINTNKDKVFSCIYDYPGDFSEGFASVEQNGKEGVINTKGKLV
ncbi:MAG: WG repeat-containing protein, partial [Bacteroidaceae bacterium]|nr:WG repeat-containing protein [Bacteroidaceae bacterium]